MIITVIVKEKRSLMSYIAKILKLNALMHEERYLKIDQKNQMVNDVHNKNGAVLNKKIKREPNKLR